MQAARRYKEAINNIKQVQHVPVVLGKGCLFIITMTKLTIGLDYLSVGAKADLPEVVSIDDIRLLATEIRSDFIMTSVKTGLGVSEAFNQLLRQFKPAAVAT